MRTNGKIPIDKFKNGAKLLSLNEVKNCDSYAAVLADDVVLIDVDDKIQSEILMDIIEDLQINCIVYQTNRGRHFLFKNSTIDKCKTHAKLACGLIADVKIGKNNSIEALKVNGQERFMEWDSDTLDELPKWLLPVNSTVDFFNMKEGDGRDSALYSYVLTLTENGFTKDESRECIKIINNYILHDSLSENDIERITRDEAFPDTLFFKNRKFLHDSFARYLINEFKIKRIEGQLHIYTDGGYMSGYRRIESAMLQLIPQIKAQQRSEVLKYIEIACGENVKLADAKLIAFKNGIFDMEKSEIKSFSPDVIITNKIPWNYIPDAYSELADNVLNKIACNDKNIRKLLEECIGYCFYRRNELSKAFVLTGEKANGKSTFLDMIKNLLGPENISALDLSELDERFSTAMMSNKLANIGDDISDEFMHGKSVSIFKKIVSGNEIKAEFKGQDTFFFNPYVKLLFSANDIPRIKDKTGAVLRRLVIIPFNAQFSRKDADYDPYIIYKLRDEKVMEYLIKIGIEGLKRVIKNNGFSESAKVERAIKNYEIQNNPILAFFEEHNVNEFINQPTKDVYKKYKMFCIENGHQEMTLTSFSKGLNSRFGLQTKVIRINNELIRIYCNY